MQEHPVPQQISSYQFRLVGDMTLKQFFQVAGGILVALLFYASNLPTIIKWPIIIFFALLGAALAFLPFEDRPLTAWILAFFRAIYLPTEFAWEKEPTKVFFQEEAQVPVENIIAPQGQAALETYLKTPATAKPAFFSVLENAESNFLAKVTSLFGTPAPSPTPTPLPTTPPPATPEPTTFTIAPVELLRVKRGENRPNIVVEEKTMTPTQPTRVAQVAPTLTAQPTVQGSLAQFSPEAGPPLPPTLPNTVVGQIMDTEGKIVEGAILDVRDANGRPVRALRSNRLGHFVVVTPLTSGSYQIVAEKEGLVFDPVDFQADGNLIPPMAIRAKSHAETPIAPLPGQNLIPAQPVIQP